MEFERIVTSNRLYYDELYILKKKKKNTNIIFTFFTFLKLRLLIWMHAVDQTTEDVVLIEIAKNWIYIFSTSCPSAFTTVSLGSATMDTHLLSYHRSTLLNFTSDRISDDWNPVDNFFVRQSGSRKLVFSRSWTPVVYNPAQLCCNHHIMKNNEKLPLKQEQ